MELDERLSGLEENHDWRGFARVLEESIAGTDNAQERAGFHLRLGRVLRQKFLDGKKALAHLTSAIELDPTAVEALVEARNVYWELGQLANVKELLELELELTDDARTSAVLRILLGDILTDLGALDDAAQSYALALRDSEGELTEASDLLQDTQVSDSDWQDRIGELLRAAHESDDGSDKSAAFLRAARIARRFAPEEMEGMLRQAFAADPASLAVGALYESTVAAQDGERIAQEHQQLIDDTEDPSEKARIAYIFGQRWALKLENPVRGVEFVETALKNDPSNESAFSYICDSYERLGDWDRVLTLADELTAAHPDDEVAHILVRAGTVAWREKEDLDRAEGYFERLRESIPSHPAITGFEEALTARPPADDEFQGANGVETAVSSDMADDPDATDEAEASEAGAQAESESDMETETQGEEPSAEAEAETETVAAPFEEDADKVAELRAKLDKQRDAKRHHEYVKTLVALAESVADASEKREFYLEAAELYAKKFVNHAEAMRTYEKVLAVDSENAVALEHLREMYAKRRDWEKLIGLMRDQAQRQEAGPAQAAAFKEIAELALAKIKNKPDVCIGLWADVLESDRDDPDALSALTQLYERGRKFEELANVLEKRIQTAIGSQRAEFLLKLGQVAGDRLKDDARAVEAYRELVELVPGERRHQEQLKKRYIALGRWDDLEDFYKSNANWDEFIRVLESQEARSKDPEQRAGMLLKVGELWTTQKGRPERAVRAYEKVLALDPEHREAAERLIPIYEAAKNAKGLVNVLEVKLPHVEADDEKLEILRQLAELYETRIHDNDLAFARYREAFAVAPGDAQGQADLERIAGVVENWADVVSAYESSITALEDSQDFEAAVGLRLALARTLVENAGERERGVAAYRAVIEAEPENAEAFAALEVLYTESETWTELLAICESRRQVLSDPDEQFALLGRIASIQEGKVGDLSAATEAFQTILEERPEDVVALEALDRLYAATEQWPDYAQILTRRIDLLPEEAELIDLKLRLAQTQLARLEDAAAALDTFREVLMLDQDNDPAREALEGLVEHETLAGEAAGVLEPIYEARGDWEQLVGALEVLVAHADEDERGVELLQRIATTSAGMLGDRGRAFEAFARALKLDPAREDVRSELEQIAENDDGWAKLVSVYVAVADGAETAVARDYQLRVAAVHERLGAIDEAAAAYGAVLEDDAADEVALAGLDALFRGAQRWNDLIGTLGRKLDLATETEAREALVAEIAAIYEEQLEQPDKAIAAFAEALESDPTSRMVLGALEGLFERGGKWDELAENLRTQLGIAEHDAEQTALMLRLAGLQEREMGATEQAIEGYRQVLDRESTNVDALEAMERLGQDEAHEVAIAEILEPLYRSQGDAAKLVGVLETKARRAEADDERVDLLTQIADLHEEAAGDLNAAFDALARALAFAPDHEPTRERLEQMGRATGRFDDLAVLLEKVAGGADEPVAIDLLLGAARLSETELSDLPRAIGLYKDVYELDSENLDAVEALEAGYRALGDAAPLARILSRKSELLSDPDQRKSALFQAAEIEESQLAEPERAVTAFRSILEIDPEDAAALDALARLYSVLARWPELIAVYERQAEGTLDADQRRALLYQIGQVQEAQLEAREDAIETYRRVLDLDPDDREALARLDALYTATGNWDELLSVLSREGDLAEEYEAVQFRFRIAELYESKLDDVSRAVELFRDILAETPEHGETQDALERIMSGDAEPVAAASVLGPVYEQLGSWERLVGVLRVEANYADDAFSKVEILHRMAQLQEDRLALPEAAFDTFAEAVEADSQNEDSLMSLERLAMALERWSAVTGLYDAQLNALVEEEPERFVELGLRVAQLYEVQLENAEAAIERYARVLGVEPENQNAVRALDRLYTHTENWSELTTILRKEAEIGQTPDEILDLKHRLGQVYQHRLNDLDEALSAYRDILSAAPEHEASRGALEGLFHDGQRRAEVGEILEPLYQAAGEWEHLLQVHEARLEGTTDADERLALFYRMAEDAEDRLLDPGRSLGVLTRALQEQPLDERTGEELERLASLADEGWERAANAYADALEIDGLGGAEQAALGKRLARVFEEELSDIAKAEGAYAYVLEVAPTDGDALLELDRIYSDQEKWADLAGILERRAKLDDALEHERSELCLRLGGIYEESLFQNDDAIRVFRLVVDEYDNANEDAISALERIYRVGEAWTELDALFAHELEHAAGDAQEAEILGKRARLGADHLGKVDDAIAGWLRVLELRGEDPEALGALAGLYEQLERWAELTDVLERQFDVSESDEERVHVLAARARLFGDALGREDEALETWQRVLDVDPEYLPALRALVVIWRGRDESLELVESIQALIERAAPLLEAEEVVASYRELAETYATKLEQPYDAADAWKQLLEIDPTDLAALDALEAIYVELEQWKEVAGVKMHRGAVLEESADKIEQWLAAAAMWASPIGEADGATEPNEKVLEVDPDHEQAFSALEGLHTAAERWTPLTELYLAKLDRAEEDDVEARISLMRRIGCALESDGDLEQAYEALVAAFSDDFANTETIDDLERITGKADKWNELVGWAYSLLAQQTEVAPQLQLCLRLAKWNADDLGRQDLATPYYERIAQLDPNNTPVLRQVAAISRKAAEWENARGYLTKALNVASTNDERVEIQCDLGELLEKHMGEVDKGIAAYERARELAPNSLRAIEALEGSYETAGRHADLADILSAKVGVLTEDDAISVERLRLGKLYENELGNLEAAAENYESAIELGQANLAAFRGLERSCRGLERWKELAKVLERELDVVETQRERLEILMQLAQLLEEEFLEPVQAAERLEAALEIDPTREDAYEALARCYRRAKRWEELVSTYERHVVEATGREAKVAVYSALAEVLADHIEDVDRAIDAYRNALDIDDTNIAALEALGKLHEKQGEASEAIEVMGRVADLTTDGARRVDMLYRVGRAYEEQLGDRIAARDRFEMAADLDPTHLASLAALRAIALDDADWDAAARYLEGEQEHTESARARARLLVELGELYAEKLEDETLALDAYRRAIEFDDECTEAALPLVRTYIDAEDFEAAEPLAQMLVRRGRGGDRSEQHELNVMLGKVFLALGKNQDALAAYQKAHELDLTDVESVRGVAQAAFRMEDWPTALTSYQKVLTSLDEHETADRTGVYHQLAVIKQAQGQSTQAVHYFEKALSIDDEHRPTLEALVGLYSEAADWKEVASYKRQILDSVLEGDERYALLSEIGEVWATKGKNPAKAIDAYEEAYELKPDDLALLYKLLELYQETAEWSKASETLESIGELAPQAHKAAVRNALGVLYRDEDKLNDPERAVELFNECLDLLFAKPRNFDAKLLQPFERINKILTKAKDWRQLERAYRQMVKRIRDIKMSAPDVEWMLWHQLGVIYRDRIGDTEQAITAFQNASKIQPDNQEEHQILSELYEASGQYAEAIAQQLVLLKVEPTNTDVYHALYRLRLAAEDLDGAWCAASALKLLQRVTPEEQQFLDARPVPDMPPVQRRLAPDAWTKLITHPDLAPQVSGVLRAISSAALRHQIEVLKADGKLPVLDPRAKQDPNTSTITFAKTFGWVGQVLGVRTPDLYVRKDLSFAVMAAPAEPVASVAGNRVLSGLTHSELRFVCGDHLADFTEDTFVRLFYKSREELQLLFLAGVNLVQPSLGLPPESAASIKTTALALTKFLQPSDLEALRTAVRKFDEAGGKVNLKRWIRGASMTAARAGLLVCGDLAAAVQVVRSARPRPGEPTAEEKMLELIMFSVGEEYGQLRKTLGIAVTA